ncbi:discoidin domain-containing protein [Dactylosporangium sp. NPDC000555]|uniref:galactose-binding domain-containing protein n=1 Tax=Dactylosporangium sp. NPDC000555 TaxID=3154260 RepID=UPI00332E9E93
MVHSTSASRPRRARLAAFVAAVVLGAVLPVVAGAAPAAADGGNIALGRPIAAASAMPFPASYANDGNPMSYWEGPQNAFPQYITVDLGGPRNVFRVVLRLPPQPQSQWPARTQTIAVRAGDIDPVTVVGSRPYTFDPATGNAVTIDFAPGYRRKIQLVIDSNSGWPAAQLSEFEVYEVPPDPPSPPELSLSPGGLTFGDAAVGATSAAQPVTLRNTGGSPATLTPVTVTGDFQRAGGTCGATLPGASSCTITVGFRPTATGPRTGTLSVNSLSIPLSGTGVTPPPPNLAAGRPVWAESSGMSRAEDAVDRNPNTAWESRVNAFPQPIMVELAANYQVSRVVLKLPPGWLARSQTIMVMTSLTTDPWTTVADTRSYTFAPATANTVTITFPPTIARYVQLVFFGNTMSPVAQLGEFEVYPV